MLYSQKKMNILIICLYLYSKPIKNWKINTNIKAKLQKWYSQNYSRIADTTPAPTVRPPSRIAKRIPFSIAIG